MLQKGVCWKVDSGKDISIWFDPWIQNLGNRFISTVFSLDKHVFMARDLIKQESWDKELIVSVINERGAQQSLSIPLSNQTNYYFFWLFERRGSFSIKSAYGALLSTPDTNPDQHSKRIWRKLWKLPLLPQVMSFVWRAGNNVIPTSVSLLQR